MSETKEDFTRCKCGSTEFERSGLASASECVDTSKTSEHCLLQQEVNFRTDIDQIRWECCECSAKFDNIEFTLREEPRGPTPEERAKRKENLDFGFRCAGFDDHDDYLKGCSAQELGGKEVRKEALTAWQDHDGTKTGLLNLIRMSDGECEKYTKRANQKK